MKLVRNITGESQKYVKKGQAIINSEEIDDINEKTLFNNKTCIICISADKVF